MLFGDILRDLAMLALIVCAALAIFWLRSERRGHLWFWARVSVLLLVCAEIGVIEGSLLSAYGFGWFVLATRLTLLGIKKIAPKLLGKIDRNAPVIRRVPMKEFFGLALAFCFLPMSIFAADKIRIGFPDLAATFIPIAIGDKRGFFQRRDSKESLSG